MLNKCCFIGHLGKDPEIRTTQAGKELANLSLGVTEKWKDASGERKERTEWVRVVIFSEGLARVAKEYLRKGSKVYIEGQLQTRKWTDQQGQEKYSTEVVLQGYNAALVLLDGKPQGESRAESRHEPEPQQSRQSKPAPSYALHDEIPFGLAFLVACGGGLLQAISQHMHTITSIYS